MVMGQTARNPQPVGTHFNAFQVFLLDVLGFLALPVLEGLAVLKSPRA